jgi:hypothetical protein
VLDFVRSLEDMQTSEKMQRVQVLADGNPGEANRMILGGYHLLSIALGRFLHGNADQPENATFATFAAWSAQSLRADVMLDAESERLPRRPARRLFDRVAEAAVTDPNAVARNIALGQAAIYEETGPAMRALLQVTVKAVDDAFKVNREPDWRDVWTAVTGELISKSNALNAKEAAPPRLSAPDVTLLQNGLAPYFQVVRLGLATATSDVHRKKRAELILLGNLRLVAYEQRRLQPVLERNLAYLPAALRLKVASRWMGRPTLLSSAVTRAYPHLRPHLAVLDEAFQIAATRYLYSITVGAEELRLGTDLPLPPPAHPMLCEDQSAADREHYAEGVFFPYHLQVIESSELGTEWHKHDRSYGQGVRTSVDNWLRYPERMNFIANLFRSRQQLAALYSRPSSAPVPVVPQPPLGPVHDGFAGPTNKRVADQFGLSTPPTSS